MIILQTISNKEFIKFNKRCITDLTEMYKKTMPESEAIKKAEEEQNELLFNGGSTENHHIYTIESNNKTVGYIWFSKINPNTAFIFYLYIFKEYRNSGYGFKAMKLLEENIIECSASNIRLHVLKENKPGIKLYSKLGYKEFKDYKGYNKNDSGLLLQKKIGE